MIGKRLKEIQDRKIEIRSLLESDGDVNLEDIQKELDGLEVEERGIKDKQALANKINVEKVEVRQIEKPKEDKKEMRDFTSMKIEEVLTAPEYRSAYIKRLQGKELDEVEKRALTTASNSAGAAVPTTTLNMIIDKLRQTSALFERISVSYVPGNLSLVVANAKNAAAWKTEGGDGTPADDTVTSVSLTGYELIKLVEISAAAEAMTIDAFESYIASEIGRQLSIAVENAILNGDGSGEPTGVLQGVTFVDDTNATTWANNASVAYDELVDGLALLPTMYHQNAVFVMNRKMLFSGIRKIKGSDNQPIFAYNPQDKAAMTILGYPVVLDDYMPDDTILLGDFNYYYMNFSKAPEISSSREAAFKSGKVTYRGLAVADGKPALAEAFVKIYKAAA